MQDGLSTEYKNVQFLSGTNIQEVTVSGALPFAPVYTGSPSLGNNTIQFGQVSGAGIANPVAVVFGTAFAAAPTSVIVTPIGSAVVGLYVSGATAGSFVFYGAGSNLSYSWMAAGSGRL